MKCKIENLWVFCDSWLCGKHAELTHDPGSKRSPFDRSEVV
mgnify:CR=1 FL=1